MTVKIPRLHFVRSYRPEGTRITLGMTHCVIDGMTHKVAESCLHHNASFCGEGIYGDSVDNVSRPTRKGQCFVPEVNYGNGR